MCFKIDKTLIGMGLTTADVPMHSACVRTYAVKNHKIVPRCRSIQVRAHTHTHTHTHTHKSWYSLNDLSL